MPRGLQATLLLLASWAAHAPAAGAAAVPEPVEFERAAPPRPASVAAGSGFVARPVRPGRRFNLVGLSWRGRAEPEIALRTRRAGRPWGRWTPATGHHSRGTSEPIWVGQADWVQYRMSRSVPRLRLHFVNTTGNADGGPSRWPRAAGASARARTSARAPRIRPRSAWGAERCPPRRVSYSRVRAAVVHHTVSANGYTKAHTPAAILAICRFHRYTNGWDDIGYNFVVDRFGRIWEGRAGGVDEAVTGAHAQGYNAQTTGISNLGTYTSVPQSERAMSALARLIRWKLAAHGVRRVGTTRLTSAGGPAARYPAGTSTRFHRVSGHRDTGLTACPGEQLYRQLPELRERVGERLRPGAKLQVEAPIPELVAYSEAETVLGGQVLDTDSRPVTALPFELQALGRAGWATLATGVSDAEGRFSAGTVLRRTAILRWKFAGDETYRVFRGDGAVVGVAPVISLEGSAATAQPGERIVVSGSVIPNKRRRMTLIAERHQGEDVWKRIWRKRLRPKGGRIRRSKGFDQPGDYRFIVIFSGDSRHAPSWSPYVTLRVEEPLLPF